MYSGWGDGKVNPLWLMWWPGSQGGATWGNLLTSIGGWVEEFPLPILLSCPLAHTMEKEKKTNFMRVCIRRYKQMSKCVEAHVFMGFAQACCPLHPSMRAWVLKVRDGLALPDPSHSSCQENRTVKLWRINIQWQLPISHGTFSNCTYLVISFAQGTKSPGCIVHPSHHTETFTLSWETFTLLIFFTSWFWEHILWYLGLLLNPTSGIPSGGALKISWYWG